MAERSPYETPPVVDGPLHGIAPLQIQVQSRPLIADFSVRFYSVGSCFADRVAHALGALGFSAFADSAVTNHFSTRSLVPLLSRWAEGRAYTKDDLHWFAGGNACVSPFHKNLSASGSDAVDRLLSEMHVRDAAARRALAEADMIFLTLGSATYLQLRQTGAVLAYSVGVAPADRVMLTMSVSEVVDDLETIYQRLSQLCRRRFHLVLTVSPQRYGWPPSPGGNGDGSPSPQQRVTPGLDPVVHSNLDKAKLRAAIDEFTRMHPDDPVEYFPAYDIVMDELRLYETFSNNHRDHLHVGFPTTSNYVINRFLLSHCTPPVIAALQDFRRDIGELERAMVSDHSPAAQTRAREFVQRMRAHCDQVGCHGLYGRVREALAKKHTRQTSDNDGARSDSEFRAIRTAHIRLDESLSSWRQEGKRVAVYGAGRHTRMLLRQTTLAQAPVIVVADDYPEADTFEGIPLVPREELAGWAPDVVIVSSVDFQSRMLEHLRLDGAFIYPVYANDELHEAQRTMLAYEASLRGLEAPPLNTPDAELAALGLA